MCPMFLCGYTQNRNIGRIEYNVLILSLEFCLHDFKINKKPLLEKTYVPYVPMWLYTEYEHRTHRI
jgi:hypothetical protein